MIADHKAVDLFAGPGGWDVAATRLGLDVVGIEWNAGAVATRRAAGLSTIHDDVRKYGPQQFPDRDVLIASPPCQTFSTAGNGAGRRHLGVVKASLDAMVSKDVQHFEFDDERTALILEPMRWVLESFRLGTPYSAILMEQVPTVQPVWDAYAGHLRALGYSVETARLNAEQFGVPQTRKRSILVAGLSTTSLPTPTHSRFHSRNRSKLDAGVLPWVSMAEALGWGGAKADWHYVGSRRSNATVRMSSEPAPTLAFGHEAGAIWRVAGESERRTTIAEAAALQTFPQSHPWRGSMSSQFQQIGNAVPPLLAEAVLRSAFNLSSS